MSTSAVLPLGPVMVDVAGPVLLASEREWLRHPAIGGVILFQRNFETPAQLRALTAEIHALREPRLLVAVDHEGGRVQRFQLGFTKLPAMQDLGRLYERSPGAAEAAAESLGRIMAFELLDHGVDITFAPVLDIDFGGSSVIGNRAYSPDPAVVAALATRQVAGMRAMGMGAVGKHFPGHGYVRADSHHEVPVDERPWPVIEAADLLPYRLAIPQGLAGVMPAHVIYRAVDPQAAGFSRHWMQDVLRGDLGFRGVVFSDDLSMEGASVAGDMHARARAAFSAGCDMVLVCNAPAAARELLDRVADVRLSAERAALFRPGLAGGAAERRAGDYFAARRVFAEKLSA